MEKLVGGGGGGGGDKKVELVDIGVRLFCIHCFSLLHFLFCIGCLTDFCICCAAIKQIWLISEMKCFALSLTVD